mmetsp:Transcript_8500/g.25755  ORF Transcript_8500/g.25755 Transcript_8500/m.25755 type:complete len:252 (+) Transcript_8500:169-924(+)
MAFASASVTSWPQQTLKWPASPSGACLPEASADRTYSATSRRPSLCGPSIQRRARAEKWNLTSRLARPCTLWSRMPFTSVLKVGQWTGTICQPPAVVFSSVREQTRCGASTARRVEIIAPMLKPTTCARSQLSTSMSASASAARSSAVYAVFAAGTVLRPMPRLSNTHSSSVPPSPCATTCGVASSISRITDSQLSCAAAKPMTMMTCSWPLGLGAVGVGGRTPDARPGLEPPALLSVLACSPYLMWYTSW